MMSGERSRQISATCGVEDEQVIFGYLKETIG